MENKDKRVLEKITQYAMSIVKYCKEINSAESLKNNSMIAEAVCFDLLQIGELAKDGLSESCKAEVELPWSQINGLRNRIVHGYSDINFQIIYETVKDDIPALIEMLSRI